MRCRTRSPTRCTFRHSMFLRGIHSGAHDFHDYHLQKQLCQETLAGSSTVHIILSQVLYPASPAMIIISDGCNVSFSASQNSGTKFYVYHSNKILPLIFQYSPHLFFNNNTIFVLLSKLYLSKYKKYCKCEIASPVANHFCGAGKLSQSLHMISHVIC